MKVNDSIEPKPWTANYNVWSMKALKIRHDTDRKTVPQRVHHPMVLMVMMIKQTTAHRASFGRSLECILRISSHIWWTFHVRCFCVVPSIGSLFSAPFTFNAVLLLLLFFLHFNFSNFSAAIRIFPSHHMQHKTVEVLNAHRTQIAHLAKISESYLKLPLNA